MPVVSTVLAQDIIDRFPSEWDYDNLARPNRIWLEALCLGFQAMWVDGVSSPGTGPPPSGAYPHDHAPVVIASMDEAKMANPPKAIFQGQFGVTAIFADVLALQTKAHLIANTTLDVKDGAIAHAHGFTSFGSADNFVGLVTTPLQATGLFDVESSVLPVWLKAFGEGLIAHLTVNAGMSLALGSGHTHAFL